LKTRKIGVDELKDLQEIEEQTNTIILKKIEELTASFQAFQQQFSQFMDLLTPNISIGKTIPLENPLIAKFVERKPYSLKSAKEFFKAQLFENRLPNIPEVLKVEFNWIQAYPGQTMTSAEWKQDIDSISTFLSNEKRKIWRSIRASESRGVDCTELDEVCVLFSVNSISFPTGSSQPPRHNPGRTTS